MKFVAGQKKTENRPKSGQVCPILKNCLKGVNENKQKEARGGTFYEPVGDSPESSNSQTIFAVV